MNNQLLDFAVATALEAGEIIRSKHGTITAWDIKEGRGDIVTEVDRESESLILDRISKAFPDHNIVTEETGKITVSGGDAYTWFIDPLDGTRNFAMGIPFFATTLAVVKGNEVLAGVTYDPLHNETFKAAKGEGAWLNEKRLEMPEDSELEDALISVSWSRRRPGSDKFPSYIELLHEHTSYLRRFGSAALAIAYVAAGRIDAYIQGMITPWDIATGILLVQEAGGQATDFGGELIDFSRSHSDVLASKRGLHERLLEEVVARG